MDRVEETEAIGLAGPDADTFPVSGATVALGSSSTVVIAVAGDDPSASGVWNAEEFRLIGPAPAPVTSRLMGPMPFTTAGSPPELPVHLFVRLHGACLYLGVVRVSMCETSEDVLARCHLTISPPLSRETLDLVRPPATPPPPLPDLGWLGDVGTAPGRALERFVTSWYPSTHPQPLSVDMPDFMPRELADFYRLAARRPAIMGGYNRIVPIHELRPESGAGLLVFGVECQGGWTWSIPRAEDDTNIDPPVWLEDHRGEDHRPVAEQEPLSSFLLQFTLKEAAITAPYRAISFDLPRRFLPQLEDCLQRVPLRSFLSPVAPTDFFVGPGLVATVAAGWDKDKAEVCIGAHHRSALHPLGRLGLPWRAFDG
ncbi:hypothetical protein [Streptomyces griseocarneus]|uniref:hypothetical protein n=1 Tax=Streptomyces griseocarneus TaxID=51201 RepID=UPI001CCA2532|nr:hypothetical protein [Streptomyces griseocarneus]MBZ6475059.1 hypothetical protein [Streptomyces griseocarneus]